MAQPKKVYEYSPDKVRSALKTSFKKRGREATLADLVADTALPRVQVEEQLPALADEYDARLRVTESGEVLYSFPRGMRSRYTGFVPGAKRFLKGALKAGAAVLSFLFKAWIVLMLVGYFVFFIALLVLFLVGGIAAQSGSKGSSRRGGGGLNLVGSMLNLFVRIWFYSEFLKGPEDRYSRRVDRERGRKPLHKAVFSFIFGDGDPNADWDTVERKAVLSYLRNNSGVISLEEYMILSGKSPEEASGAINAYCVEFDGSPEASPEGTVYYRFAGIMKGLDAAQSPTSSTGSAPAKRLEPFSANPKSANAWFCAMNAVNIAFGSFFLAGGAIWGESALRVLRTNPRLLRQDILMMFYAFVLDIFSAVSANPVLLVSVALGAVPLAFAFFFYAVPAIRAARLKRKNDAVRVENLRRVVYGRAWANPDGVEAAASAIDSAAAPSAPKAQAKLLDELAAYSPAQIESSGRAGFRYAFPDLKRTRQSMRTLRDKTDRGEFALGKTVFDTESKEIEP
jgi:hypothetical protein